MHSAYGMVAWSSRVSEELAKDMIIRERGAKLDHHLSLSAEECGETKGKFRGEGNFYHLKTPDFRTRRARRGGSHAAAGNAVSKGKVVAMATDFPKGYQNLEVQ